MTEALDDHGTRLREIDGVAALTAIRLIGRTGRAPRFKSEHAFATYAGVGCPLNLVPRSVGVLIAPLARLPSYEESWPASIGVGFVVRRLLRAGG